MSYLIAITGKGGVGKTTIAALMVQRLIKNGRQPVLAVDADPNTCLDEVLGVKVQQTVGGIREEAREIAGKGMSTGIAKQHLLEMKIAETLVEAENFDLIAMGRSEGPGCYCYANNVLKAILNEISSQYPYVVLDNEAGLENLSRRIVQKVDLLIIVADASQRGLNTVTRLHQLTHEMEMKYDKLAIVVNRLRRDKLPDRAEQLKIETNADFIIGLPEDHQLSELAERGDSILNLEDSNHVSRKLDQLLVPLFLS